MWGVANYMSTPAVPYTGNALQTRRASVNVATLISPSVLAPESDTEDEEHGLLAHKSLHDLMAETERQGVMKNKRLNMSRRKRRATRATMAASYVLPGSLVDRAENDDVEAGPGAPIFGSGGEVCTPPPSPLPLVFPLNTPPTIPVDSCLLLPTPTCCPGALLCLCSAARAASRSPLLWYMLTFRAAGGREPQIPARTVATFVRWCIVASSNTPPPPPRPPAPASSPPLSTANKDKETKSKNSEPHAILLGLRTPPPLPLLCAAPRRECRDVAVAVSSGMFKSFVLSLGGSQNNN